MKKALIIAGQTGVGKTELVKILDRSCPFVQIMGHTTRKKRSGDYKYLYQTEEGFKKMQLDDELFCPTYYNGTSYGYDKCHINTALNYKYVPVFIVALGTVDEFKHLLWDEFGVDATTLLLGHKTFNPKRVVKSRGWGRLILALKEFLFTDEKPFDKVVKMPYYKDKREFKRKLNKIAHRLEKEME